MNRRSRSIALVLCAILLACGRASPPPARAPASARHDAPAVHGMALFGEAAVFASHLPMFHAPHDFQVVLELSLATDPRRDKRAFHTIAPAPFELARAREPGFMMDVEIFEGHFERGGKSLGSTKATITRVIRFNPLVAEAPRPAAPAFFLVGTPDDAYLLHVITTRPDFDQIVRVRVPRLIAGDLTAAGRSPTSPLAVNDTVELGALTATVVAELYQEHGDLE